MKLFVECTRNGGSCYMRWEGQTSDQVTALLSVLGATNVQFIDESTWLTAQSTITGGK